MRRLLFLLPLGAAAGLLALGQAARAQSGEQFGVLRSAPAPLPAGMEPAAPADAAPANGASANPFPLPASAGPWMIAVAHYVGFDGSELSRQVALDLRNNHHLEAYIYNRGDEERRQQDEEWEQLKAKYPPGTPLKRRRVRIQDQYAVLVGSFKDSESASAMLPRIKALPVPVLKLSSGAVPYEIMTYQEPDPQTKEMVSKTRPVHPYHNAMVVRNPLVPAAAAKSNWDPIFPKLNADEDYSLLKNAKGWTLLVKVYQGSQIIQAGGSGGAAQGKSGGFFGSIGLDFSHRDTLNLIAAQAHELARFLREPRFGFDAYVLHTRYTSIVTVGSFTGPDDPAMQRTINQLASLKFSTSQGGSDPIGLMPTPAPLPVPRP
jgi:hypothetical protein